MIHNLYNNDISSCNLFNNSSQWDYETQFCIFLFDNIDQQPRIDKYNLTKDFKSLKKYLKGFEFEKVIEIKLWIDGFHVSPNSKQVNASLVYIIYFSTYYIINPFE